MLKNFCAYAVDDGKTQGYSYPLFFGKSELINFVSILPLPSNHAGTADNKHAISLNDTITNTQITTLLHHARFLI